jgi:hypothetical protein
MKENDPISKRPAGATTELLPMLGVLITINV